MPDESKESKALAAALEAVKATLAIATGTLVFSAELLKEQIKLGALSKYLLVVSWCLLGVSIVAGVLVHLRIPVMIFEDKLDIHDKWFDRPGRIHHIAFILGVLVLGAAMIAILFSPAPPKV